MKTVALLLLLGLDAVNAGDGDHVDEATDVVPKCEHIPAADDGRRLGGHLPPCLCPHTAFPAVAQSLTLMDAPAAGEDAYPAPSAKCLECVDTIKVQLGLGDISVVNRCMPDNMADKCTVAEMTAFQKVAPAVAGGKLDEIMAAMKIFFAAVTSSCSLCALSHGENAFENCLKVEDQCTTMLGMDLQGVLKGEESILDDKFRTSCGAVVDFQKKCTVADVKAITTDPAAAAAADGSERRLGGHHKPVADAAFAFTGAAYTAVNTQQIACAVCTYANFDNDGAVWAADFEKNCEVPETPVVPTPDSGSVALGAFAAFVTALFFV